MIRSFVIRKEGDELSERLSDECISSADQFGITPEKINGVYSNHDEIIEKEGLFPYPKIVKKLRPGYKGCFLSHYQIWKKSVEENIPVLIFEHDALMIRPLPENILDLFDTVLVLDRHSRDSDYENILKIESNTTIYQHDIISDIRYKTINNTHVKGSHAHLIKPEGAKNLIRSINTYGYIATDVAVNQCYIKYFTIEPSIARVNPFFSSGNNKEYSHLR